MRTLTPQMRELAEKRIKEVTAGIVAAFGMTCTCDYLHGYPVTFNHAGQVDFVVGTIEAAFGAGKVDTTVPPTMGS